MTYAAGVDVGSTQTKAVIINEDLQIVGRALVSTGANVTIAAENAYELALRQGNIHEEEEGVGFIVGTGYGRYKVTFGDTQTTEISCHGRGAVHMFAGTRTVVDMGGQDTKAIKVSPTGEILDFVMNDKCAAGTGRFLGAAASALDLPLDELGPTALLSSRPVKITTTCTEKEVTFTGGVANNIGMVSVLNQELGFEVNVSEDSHFMGAVGAALFAMDRIVAGRNPARRLEVRA